MAPSHRRLRQCFSLIALCLLLAPGCAEVPSGRTAASVDGFAVVPSVGSGASPQSCEGQAVDEDLLRDRAMAQIQRNPEFSEPELQKVMVLSQGNNALYVRAFFTYRELGSGDGKGKNRMGNLYLDLNRCDAVRR